MAIVSSRRRREGNSAASRDDWLTTAKPGDRCAASYGFRIAKNHAFNDGNKRTAFQSMYAFLGLNGRELDATEVDAVEIMVGVADGSVSEKRLAAWLRDNTAAPRRKRKGAN